MNAKEVSVKIRRNNTIGLVIISIFLSVSFLCAAFYSFLLVSSWLYKDKIIIDNEYAMFVADGDEITKRYSMDQRESLHFFAADKCKKTLFINSVPNLKIIDDQEYYIEITTNEDVHDIIYIHSSDDFVSIECDDSEYNLVHESDLSYDYNYGLYVDCTRFDITVHAPVSRFYTDTNLTLDFEVAKADTVIIDFSFDGVKGEISGIDAKEFNLFCSGSSDLELIGNVSETAEIKAWHDTHINAEKLTADQWDTSVTRSIGGFSYIIRDKWYQFKCDKIFGTVNTIEFFVYVPFSVWICLEIVLIKERKRIIASRVNRE